MSEPSDPIQTPPNPTGTAAQPEAQTMVPQAGALHKRRPIWLSAPFLAAIGLLLVVLLFFVRERQHESAKRAALGRTIDSLAASFVPAMLGEKDDLSREQLRRIAEAGQFAAIGLARPDGSLRYRYNLPDATTTLEPRPTSGQWGAGGPNQVTYTTPVKLADSVIGYLKVEMKSP